MNTYLECACYSDEHRMVYTLDDEDLYVSVFLPDYPNFWKRIVNAIKYIFGYKCKYGHFDCFLFNKQNAGQLKDLLEKFLHEK